MEWAHMLLLNVALQNCRLPRESQVLKCIKSTWDGRTTITEDDSSDMPTKLRPTLTGIAHKFIAETFLKVRPQAIPPWVLPKWGDRLRMEVRDSERLMGTQAVAGNLLSARALKSAATPA